MSLLPSLARTRALFAAALLFASVSTAHAASVDRPNLTIDALETSISDGANVATPASVPQEPTPIDQPSADAEAVDPTTPATRYATLEAAVAAQAQPEAVADELACLAGAVYFESRGEPLAGQLAVAQVIINRAASGRFPRGLCPVVTQPGQFSFVRGGRVPAIDHQRRDWKVALAVAQIALADSWRDQAPHALFFHAVSVAPQWRRERVATIGRHIFYR